MKKWMAVTLSAALAVTMLTGCVGTKDKKGEDVVVPVDDAVVLESGDVELTVWSGAEDQELIKKITDKFIEEHKGEANITVKWEEMAEGDCRSALLGDVLHGPDVYTTTDGEVSTLASGGGARVVSSPDELKGSNLESAVDAMTIEGKAYAYPITADNGYFLYYNKQYFSENDVKSFDKMLEVAAAANKKVAMDWSSGWYMYSFFGKSGLEVGLNDDGVTNYCNWNATDTEVKGADIVNSLAKIALHAGFGSMGQDKWIEGAKSGEVVAIISGVWDSNAISEAWGSNFAATKLPTYNCAGKEVQMASFFGYKCVGVNPYSEHIGWADELAKYIANSENQQLRFEMRGQAPASKEAAASKEVQASVAVQAVLAQSEYSTLQRIGGNYWGPMSDFGALLLAGNPQGLTSQEIIDSLVEKITSSTVQ